MSGKQKRMWELEEGRRLTGVGRMDKGDGRCAPSGRVPWYSAQSTVPGLTYLLTASGYVVL